MLFDETTVSGVIPASPELLWDAFLDPALHAEMTGAGATAGSDGAFTAWDGYIAGRTLESDRPRRIVQAWRTSEFPSGAPDSRLEILFQATPRGTRVTFVHTEIPKGQGAAYRGGWKDYYLTPIRTWARTRSR